MVKYKCIIFDCDGVLVDSEAISAKVFIKMMAELGRVLDFETVVEQITGTSMRENLAFFEKHLGKDLPKNFEQEFRKRSFKAYKTDLKAIPGVHELIEKIDVPVGVASSGPCNKIELNLTTTGLIDKFRGNVFSSYDIGSWKPEPDIYLHAAKKMGYNPSECIVIEDSRAGVKAARAGGFKVYALTNKKQSSKFEELGAHVFMNMHELGALLAIG